MNYRLVRLGIAALFCSGCSFLFVKKAPSPEAVRVGEPVDCTSSKAAPVIDTVVAGIQAVRIGVASSADESVYEDAPIDRDADVAIGAAMLALFATSAVYGYVTTGKCADVQEQQSRAQRQQELQRRGLPYGYPQPYGPGPYYPPGPYYVPGPYPAPAPAAPSQMPPPPSAPEAPGDSTEAAAPARGAADAGADGGEAE